jgi:hypothetical protein
LCLLPVLRPLLFSRRSALQQFQLALHRLSEVEGSEVEGSEVEGYSAGLMFSRS